MNITIPGGPISGTVTIPASKSQAHRLLLCAAMSNTPSTLFCDGLSHDIQATIHCLCAMGADIAAQDGHIHVSPRRTVEETPCPLPCGESGSTLRFLLPIAAARGISARFLMEGRLPQRPLAPLDAQLRAHGVSLHQNGHTLLCQGRLLPGNDYQLPGNISSQYISGLLFALPLLNGDSTLTITGPLESAAYISMTEDALVSAGIHFTKVGQTYHIPGAQTYHTPAQLQVEGDWSNAAFFLCAGALGGNGIRVGGLNLHSSQGDRAILEILERFGAVVTCQEDTVCVYPGTLRGITVNAAPIPDLIPAISAVGALAHGDTYIKNAARLRLKESDRLSTTAQLLRALGGSVEELADGLIIHGQTALAGGRVDACGDHRIAMTAAVAACGCLESVTVSGSHCVAKSYPRFWDDYFSLKGACL